MVTTSARTSTGSAATSRPGSSRSRGAERLSLSDVAIADVHRFSKGREWETGTPRRLPEPPFLLTDDPACRVALDGRVRYASTAWATPMLAAWTEKFGAFSVPLLGCDWFGVLRVERPEAESAWLTAFVRDSTEVSGRAK